MKVKFNAIAVVAFVLTGCVLFAGIWLIADKRPQKQRMEKPVKIHTTVEPLPSENLLPETSPPLSSESDSRPAISDSESSPDFKHLQLIGIAIDPGGSHAVIFNETTQQQALFHTGDSVDGALIEEIFADRVILASDGQVFTLSLGHVSSGDIDAVFGYPVDDMPHSHVLSPTDQADIENAWNETSELMAQIELSGRDEKSGQKGVEVQTVVENSVFEKIGFHKGDVIVQVDDMEIVIADDAMEIYNCLRTKETVRFVIMRNGQTETLNYDASDL